jgi:hypothetical protein
MELPPIIADQWFNVAQTLGIIANSFLLAWAMLENARTRRYSNHLSLAAQHRDLWEELSRRPELSRILEGELDLEGAPITVAEEEYMRLIILHFHTGWEIGVRDSMMTKEAFRLDVRDFFRLPIPRAVWKKTRAARDPRFVKFVESCLAKKG